MALVMEAPRRARLHVQPHLPPHAGEIGAGDGILPSMQVHATAAFSGVGDGARRTHGVQAIAGADALADGEPDAGGRDRLRDFLFLRFRFLGFLRYLFIARPPKALGRPHRRVENGGGDETGAPARMGEPAGTDRLDEGVEQIRLGRAPPARADHHVGHLELVGFQHRGDLVERVVLPRPAGARRRAPGGDAGVVRHAGLRHGAGAHEHGQPRGDEGAELFLFQQFLADSLAPPRPVGGNLMGEDVIGVLEPRHPQEKIGLERTLPPLRSAAALQGREHRRLGAAATGDVREDRIGLGSLHARLEAEPVGAPRPTAAALEGVRDRERVAAAQRLQRRLADHGAQPLREARRLQKRRRCGQTRGAGESRRSALGKPDDPIGDGAQHHRFVDQAAAPQPPVAQNLREPGPEPVARMQA